MPKLIKDSMIVDDDWQIISKSVAKESKTSSDKAPAPNLPAGKILVPVSIWCANKNQLASRRAEIGVWLDSDEAPELIADDLDQLALIAINFPVFSDGRGYSYARLLREKYNYQGELRAIGDVLRDQLFFMKRCGFNSFALREDLDIEASLSAFADFSEVYQAAVDQPEPLFRRC